MEGESLAGLGDGARLMDHEASDVVAWSSGKLHSMARLRSRIGTPPSTLTEPSGCGRTPGTATSCSSVMSPTISSENVLERD